jgi:hypothetical protein
VEWKLVEVAIGMGHMPRVVGDNEARVLHSKSYVEPYLIAMLGDPQRWLAAHVILICRHLHTLDLSPQAVAHRNPIGRENKGPVTLSGALVIERGPDGEAIIDEAQREKVRAYWVDRFQKGELASSPKKVSGTFSRKPNETGTF